MSNHPTFSFSTTGTTPVEKPVDYNGSQAKSASSSGATTPQTGGASQASSFYGLPTLRSAWTGLLRTLSYDDTTQPHLHTSGGMIREIPPPDPVSLTGWKSSTRESSRVMNVPLAEEIRKMVPERLQIVDGWQLVYSLVQDGTLLGTLYRKCSQFSERRRGQRIGFVIVIRDDEGGVFGAYMSDIPRISKSYFGNGECFLWRASRQVSLPPPPSADTTNMTRNTTISPAGSGTTTSASTGESCPGNETDSGKDVSMQEHLRFKVYPYSGKNDYCMLCEPGFLSLGGGNGRYGLWVNENLSRGHSDPCPTFDNEGLSDQGGRFGIIGVEVWAIGG